MYGFAPASENESVVFGAARPGYSHEQVKRWVEFMQAQGIQRVCCLLTDAQLKHYGELFDVYRQSFGSDQVFWAPIEDFQLADRDLVIHQILPFLADANQRKEKVVVHCSGGIGRTGQVLAAWLVAEKGFSNQAAISTVRATGRNPYEAAIAAPLRGCNPWKIASKLHLLLDDCRRLRKSLD